MKSLKRGTLHWKDDWILNTIFCRSHLVESHISVSWGTKHVDCPPLSQKHQLGWVPWNQHETTTFCWKKACFSGSVFKFPVPHPRKNIRISTTFLQYSKAIRGHIQITFSKSLSWWDDFSAFFFPHVGWEFDGWKNIFGTKNCQCIGRMTQDIWGYSSDAFS